MTKFTDLFKGRKIAYSYDSSTYTWLRSHRRRLKRYMLTIFFDLLTNIHISEPMMIDPICKI